MSEHTLTQTIGTDVAHILIFHPDDLQHTTAWPMGWYAEPAAWKAESSAGRLIGWCTRSDGGFKVHLTKGDLDQRALSYRRQQWTFPYTVRHGKVFLDNTDCLPGESGMYKAEDYPESWFMLENSDYDVTASALHWDAEPGATEAGFDTLPNYIVQFKRRASDAAAPEVARRPPDLTGMTGESASDEPPQLTSRSQSDRLSTFDFSTTYPAAVCSNVAPTGQQFSSQGETELDKAAEGSEDRFAIFNFKFIVAPELKVGALAQVCGIQGAGGAPNEPKRYDLRSEGLVRIISLEGAWTPGDSDKTQSGRSLFSRLTRKTPPPADPHCLMGVHVEAVKPDDKIPEDIDVEDYRARMLAALTPGAAFADAIGPRGSYEALEVAEMQDIAELSRFLLRHLPMPSTDRLQLESLSLGERARALIVRLDAL